MLLKNNIFKGSLICFAIALPAWVISKASPTTNLIGAPVISILIGMILRPIILKRCLSAENSSTGNSSNPFPSSWQAGISFSSKELLQYAIILLGFDLNLVTIKNVGLISLPIILATISTSLIVSYTLYRFMNISSKTSILIGVGSSICGGSAIAATAPIIHAKDEEIAQSLSVIFLFNVIAAILFPSLGDLLHLSNHGFGLFAGTAINDTSSVTAAASTWDTIHNTSGSVLHYATIVKLTRTLAIIPITLILSLLQPKAQLNNQPCGIILKLRTIFPRFILYFILASCLNTLITRTCPTPMLPLFLTLFEGFKQVSKFLIVMAMASIGLNTDLLKLVKNSKKPIVMGLSCWVAIACVSLLLQSFLGIL